VIEIFTDLVRFLFEGLQTTEPLLEAHPQDVDGLPSWVPAWAEVQGFVNAVFAEDLFNE
jgi:hypothetical protein